MSIFSLGLKAVYEERDECDSRIPLSYPFVVEERERVPEQKVLLERPCHTLSRAAVEG